MPVKLLFTVVGFNALVLIFLAVVVVTYFRPARFGIMASLFLGWLTGFINLSTSEPQFPILLLLSFGFFLGFIVHEGVWKHALILGIFVPISQVIWVAASHQTELLLPNGVGLFIALIPAFGGAYLGRYIALAQKTDRASLRTNGGGAE